MSNEKLSVQHQSFISAIDSIRVPASVQEELKDKNWIQAMNEEMHALEKMGLGILLRSQMTRGQ